MVFIILSISLILGRKKNQLPVFPLTLPTLYFCAYPKVFFAILYGGRMRPFRVFAFSPFTFQTRNREIEKSGRRKREIEKSGNRKYKFFNKYEEENATYNNLWAHLYLFEKNYLNSQKVNENMLLCIFLQLHSNWIL